MTRPEAGPDKSHGVFSDIRHFFAHRPGIQTLVDTTSGPEREDYTHRIAQRVGIDVSRYAVLNIHRIGIDAPVRYVFEEVVLWDGESPCWPNHVATVEDIEGSRERFRIVLLGRLPLVARRLRKWFGPGLGTLFNMTAVKVQDVPDGSGFDNARYLLWECSGGYPIGVFAIYVRSAIPERGEVEQTQVFFGVGFNPYGREYLSRIHPVRKTWEWVHDRVTANVLNRFKQLCEANFGAVREGAQTLGS
jgi:hypothetical protein